MDAKDIGKLGEDAACNFLKKNKYTILSRNYRQRYGEIDIVAKRKGVVSFVEVKTRKDDSFGLPCEYVTASKREKLKKTASAYLTEHELDTACSFDVMEVYHIAGKVTRLRHIRNAFE